MSGFEAQLCHLLAEFSRKSHLASLCLSFFICDTAAIADLCSRYCEDKRNSRVLEAGTGTW